MRVAIIVLIVVGVAYALFFVAANNGSLRMESIKPPPEKNGKPDTSNWTPPSFAKTLSAAGASFAPHADLGSATLTVGPNQTITRDAAPTGKKLETATIQLSGSGGLDIRYSGTCADGSDCSQALCLCAPGSPLVPAKHSACLSHLSSLGASGGQGGACTPNAKGTLVIYPNGRTVTFANMGYAAASAELK